MSIDTTPLSPRDRKMISPKSTCSPVCRVRRLRSDSSVCSCAFPFPPFDFNSSNKRKRVTFGKCDISEYEKGSAPNKFRRILCAPLKTRKSKSRNYKKLPAKILFPRNTRKNVDVTDYFQRCLDNAPKKSYKKRIIPDDVLRSVRGKLF